MNGKNNRINVARRFSASAASYDRAARVQPVVVERVCEMLACAGTPENILEIGCGTGMLTEKLVTLFPTAQIDAVDVSDKMIRCSQSRLAVKNPVRWKVADVRELPENRRYHLIVSCSALHWIVPVDAGLGKLSGLLSENGRLVFGLMVEGTLGELRAARLRAAPHKSPLGKLPSQPEVRAALQKAGLKIHAERRETVRLRYSSAAALLRSLHDQGVTAGNVSLSAVPLNRGEINRLIMDYDKLYGNGNGVYATYRIAYFIGAKS